MKKISQFIILEDSPEDQTLYRRYLKKAFGDDLNIRIFDKGEVALASLRQEGCDCVLLDYNLPDMTGLDFLKHLSELKLKPSPPVIMLTGSGNERIAVEALKSGVDDYLMKGDLQPDLLHDTVINAIEKHQHSEALEEKEAEIQHQAYHDHLTGAPNRVQFEELCNQALLKAKRNQSQLAVLMLDLDHFKQVNDSLGHEVGDLLLVAAVQRFQECLRQSDYLARLGGDEFALNPSSGFQLSDSAMIYQLNCGE